MGYSWTSISKGDKILTDHWNEIKNNLDDLYSDLQLSSWDWEYFPVSLGSLIKYDHLSELRDATDYADDQNYCRDHNGTYNVTVLDGEDVSFLSGDFGTYYNNQHTTYKNDHNTGYDSGDDSTYESSHYTGDESTYNSGVKQWYDSTIT